MVRQIVPAAQCLSCGIPFSGWSGQIARWIGVGRSADNPNLCNRCRGHLLEGLLAPCSVIQLDLAGDFQFGRVSIPGSGVELASLQQRLRSQVETAGGYVIQQGDDVSALRAYFNVPVMLPSDQVADRALDVARSLLREVIDEEASMGVSIPARLAVVSGFAEVLEMGSPAVPLPHCQRADLLPDLLSRAADHQIAVDDETVAQLSQSPLPLQRGTLTLLDAAGAQGLRALRMPKPAGSTALTPVISLLAAVLAVPCVAMVVVSPAAIGLGLGGLLAAVLPFYKAIGMSLWPRLLLTGLAVVMASANLIVTESRLHQLRRLQRLAGAPVRLPRWQRRRLRLVRLLSLMVLLLVVLEGVLRVTVMRMPLL